MFSKHRKNVNSGQQSGRFTQILLVVAIITVALLDQTVEPKQNVPDVVYVSLLAVPFGATKTAKRIVDRFFKSDKK